MTMALAVATMTGLGCDPCSGIASCARGDFLAAAGQVVEAGTGNGIDGVRLDFIRVGGVDVSVDSLSTVTHGGGYWEVEFTPSSAGELQADVRVSPPGEAPYVIRSLPLQTRPHGGDANLNQRWVTRLYFPYMGELYLEGTADTRVANTPVTFRQTGGVAIYGPGIQDSVHHTSTDPAGRVNLFPSDGPNGVYAREEGPLSGDLTVIFSSGRTSTLHGISLVPTHLYQQPSYIARGPVSP
jgi:hypothetical protein